MEKRKGKLIRISDEAYKKLKESKEPMSTQIDLLLGVLNEPKTPSVEPLGSDTMRFRKLNHLHRLTLKAQVLRAVVETSKEGIGTTRKDIIQFLSNDENYIEFASSFGYINSAPHTKSFNTLIDNELKRLVNQDVALDLNRKFYILTSIGRKIYESAYDLKPKTSFEDWEKSRKKRFGIF